MGEQFGVPVIPVNHLEGHVMTTRFAQINAAGNEVPLQQFPYLSLLATGKHTEIVLTRGVGLHTIIGITVDIAVGECIDKTYGQIKKYDNVLKDEKQI